MTHPMEDLTALLDGALPPGRAAAVERHLSGCAACCEELGRLRDAVNALRSVAPAPALPPFFGARLEARLRAERERPRAVAAVLGAIAAALPRRRLLAGAGAALVLAAGLPTGVWLLRRADTRAMVAELDLLQDWEAASAVSVDSPEDALIVAQLDELERGEATP